MAITIHESQGASFDEIVYEYDKKHKLQLVYVALSHVTSIDGLNIKISDNNSKGFIFHHVRRNDGSNIDLVRGLKGYL